MRPALASLDSLRKRHRALRWTQFETSATWAFVHAVGLAADRAAFEATMRARKVAPADSMVACFCGWGFGPIGVSVAGARGASPEGAVPLGERVLAVGGGLLRIGPFPVDGRNEGVVVPCPHPRVRVVVSHVPFDADDPSAGWLHVAVSPASVDDADPAPGEVVNCEA